MSATLDQVMSLGVMEASGAGASLVGPSHLFIAVCRVGAPALEAAMVAATIDGVRLRRRIRGLVHAKPGQSPRPDGMTPEARAAVARADELASGRDAGVDDVGAALLEAGDPLIEQALAELRVDPSGLAASTRARIGQLEARPSAAPAPPGSPAPDAPQKAAGAAERAANAARKPLALEKFGRDLSKAAREGKLEPVVGRRNEMKQVVRALLRKTKSNAVLIGDAGVGKTAIVEGIALLAAGAEAPPEIAGFRVIELSLPALVAGTTYRGEFEERIQAVVREAAANRDVVLFLDEIHMLVGAGDKSGGMDAANILKPALARGEIRVIGATTVDEFRKTIERDPALERRFLPVRVEEPTPAEAREILEKVAAGIAKHHGIVVEPEAIDAAIELSVRYLPDRRLPDKARDVLDQAAAAARFATFTPRSGSSAPTVDRDDVALIVSEWTGVSIAQLTPDRREQLAALESLLGARVLGQEAAVRSVADVVRTGLAGLGKAGRPRGSFLFVGPTGVGKTELAKALAEQLFGSEKHLIRLDMSEYQDRFTAQKLIGSPPGYVGHDEGGVLVNAVRRTPYSLVLFDEIEKADPQVLDLLLQVLDDGRLTDSHGKVADFSHAFVILTSNLLQEVRVARAIGFADAHPGRPVARGAPRDDDELRRALSQKLRPELVGRIQRVVDFLPLGREHLADIATKALSQIASRARGESGVVISWDAGAPAAIVAEVDSPALGARAIERLVEEVVARPLAQHIVSGRLGRGDEVRVVRGASGRLELQVPGSRLG